MSAPVPGSPPASRAGTPRSGWDLAVKAGLMLIVFGAAALLAGPAAWALGPLEILVGGGVAVYADRYIGRDGGQ